MRHGDLADFDSLCAATNLLSHRGPDDGAWWSDGRFFLGHRRLSIIDLAQGGQPMATPDGRYVIAFNGEIYNFVELRAELVDRGYTFLTNSDTEVILHGYHLWGTGVAKYLIGMFAFAIVDRIEKTLYLARDRFGEKPLFVHETSETISFASELGAIAALPDLSRTIDPLALTQYLCLNYVPGDRTLMDSVRRIPPATWRLYTSNHVQQESYWLPPKANPGTSGPSRHEALVELKRRVDDAILIALRSDVPVALFLSGGIDSSIIAESAVRQGKLKHAYCLDFSESQFSEWRNADTVAKSLGIELRRAVLSADALVDFFAMVEHADDPLGDSSALAVWALSREVARDYKVVISGDGGDELFGGYLTYKATLYHSLMATALPRFARDALRALGSRLPITGGKVSSSYKLMRFLRAAHLPSSQAHFTWNGSWLPAEAAALLKGTGEADLARRAISDLACRHGLPDAPSLGDLQRVDVTDYLPNDILTKVDRMTMAHGLEARAPFLIPSVAEYSLQLPDNLKLTLLSKPKQILRDLATQLYGEKIGNAKKQGFSIPIHQWLRGPARELTDRLLERNELDEIGLLDSAAVLRAKDLHMINRAQLGFELWGLMVLVAWHRARVRRFAVPRRRVDLRRLVFPMSSPRLSRVY